MDSPRQLRRVSRSARLSEQAASSQLEQEKKAHLRTTAKLEQERENHQRTISLLEQEKLRSYTNASFLQQEQQNHSRTNAWLEKTITMNNTYQSHIEHLDAAQRDAEAQIKALHKDKGRIFELLRRLVGLVTLL